jgi:hypothetical protein
MNRLLTIVFAVVFVLAGSPLLAGPPASRPTSRPTTAQAEQAHRAAAAAARERCRATPEHAQLAAALRDAERDLERARTGTDPQARVDASGRANRARIALEKLEASAIATDPDYRATSAVVEVLKRQIDDERQAAEARAREVEAKRAARQQPIKTITVGQQGLLQDPLRIIQIIDGDEMLVEVRNHGVDAWVRGFSTAGLVDDGFAHLPSPVVISGTKRYPAALGARTVFLIEPWDTDDARVERLRR